MAINKFSAKKYQMELLEKMYNLLENEEKEAQQDWKSIGKKSTQAKDWRTGELKWEDAAKTIPMYEDEYGYVPKETLTEEDQMKLEVCRQVKAELDKLL